MSGPTGVLGGIFDPVHNGHLAVAALARDFFGLDKVLFIPSGTPPHKSSTVCASSSDRLSMLKIALKDDPGAVIWDKEICRPGISYTIDTLYELSKQIKGPVYFIIGSDNLREIITWHKYQEILELVTLCVAHRPGSPVFIPDSLKKAKLHRFPSPEWGISSTMIRTYIHKGYSCRHLLPDGVVDYIVDKGLYKEDCDIQDECR